MNQIIKQISEGLANQSSRRGFFSTVGKATLGLATILAGQGFFTENALAAKQCCTGLNCQDLFPGITSTSCSDFGLSVGYYWCCLNGHQEKCSNDGNNANPCMNCKQTNGAGVTCTDCFNTSGYKCTIYPPAL